MCTRVVYSGSNGMVATGRSMDWKTDMHSNLWVFPRGMKRNGETGENSLEWTSRYGSVVTSAFEIASTDGMNEKGLVANLLWLPETEYPVRDKNKPGLAITAWVQYMLDNFATVEEAVAYIDEDTFQVVSDMMPDGSRLATLHLSISDATGDCAIFEYVGGKLTVYHSKEYKVMTNSLTYNKQLALSEYWKSIGGLSFLPGTNRAADRFARASFYINALPETDDEKIAVASVSYQDKSGSANQMSYETLIDPQKREKFLAKEQAKHLQSQIHIGLIFIIAIIFVILFSIFLIKYLKK